MEPATVSTIILNYNGREHLEACLASLSDLDFPKSNLEIIVVDNASTDDSAEMVAKLFPHVRFLRSETNLGFSRGANLGASHASGNYLALLNNDMRVDRRWLSALVEAADADEKIACVGSAILSWDGAEIDFVGRPDDAFCLCSGPNIEQQSYEIPNAATYYLFVSAGAALIRAAAFRDVGGFDADYFMYHEDVDLCWRLWLRGYKCALSPESITYHRGGASSKKLPSDYVQGMAQKHTLFTLLKVLDSNSIKDLLPMVFYYLLERGQWTEAARSSISKAIDEFYSRFDDFLSKRAEVQWTRVMSDAEMFAMLGHPFDFLLRHERYKVIKDQLAAVCSKVEFDMSPGSAAKARAALAECLSAAHFLFEQSMITALRQRDDELAALSAVPPRLTAELARKEEEIGRKQEEVLALVSERDRLASQLAAEREMLTSQLAASEERARSLSVELEIANERIAERDEEIQSLSSEAALRQQELQSLREQVDARDSQLQSLRELVDDRDSQLQALREQVDDRDARLESMKQLVDAREGELAKIKGSLGWRLLSLYGRIKYQYLLPIYKLFGAKASSEQKSDDQKKSGR